MLEKIYKMILESSPADSATILQSDLLFILFFKGTMWFAVECSRLNLLYHVVNCYTGQYCYIRKSESNNAVK